MLSNKDISKDEIKTDPTLLVSRVSFSLIELLKCETSLKRVFYETEIIKNNWSIRELQRAINSMLYERVGLSKNKKAVLKKHKKKQFYELEI